MYSIGFVFKMMIAALICGVKKIIYSTLYQPMMILRFSNISYETESWQSEFFYTRKKVIKQLKASNPKNGYTST